ncbi:MAG: hypoxanthine phosphoribosyltransferase [Bdellovibrionaceae bacterium]|nr:hypoxanthine phosphoribosyltransferase [Pseudobdellovibrionaceae bacterium]|tara:strand:- start:129914 stop:130444 length:531 start_codon:yes stop_codon:yes gene_type:complete
MLDIDISPLITEDEIKTRVQEMGAELTDKFNGKDVVAICVLKGSIMFFADLIREIKTDVVCEFLGLSSYKDAMTSSGEVKMTSDVNTSLNGKHVLIVEDIVDTGLTMQYLQNNLNNRKPASITTASLLLKPDALKCDCKVDMVGFKIPNDFVVGYGLDYGGQYRNLPFIGQVSSLN